MFPTDWIGLAMVVVGTAMGLFSLTLTLRRITRLEQMPAVAANVDASTGGGHAVDLLSREPFETAILSNYYRQALARANISFGASLLFASVGFVIIVVAGFAGGTPTEALVKLAGGSVVELVAGLFFAQSNAAQRSMAEFFEKLRTDRLSAQARELLADIEDTAKRDSLRAELVLRYSGLPTGT